MAAEREHQSYKGWVLYGLAALLVAVAIDVAVELQRGQIALQSWICATTPTPAGAQACQTAFVVRWITARLPLYVLGVGAVALVAGAVATFVRRNVAAGETIWARLLRVVVVVVCLIALSELVACAGDATCNLSLSCS